MTASFESLAQYRAPIGDGRCAFVVALDCDTDDFAHLIKQCVVIDAVTYRCVAVERRAHAAPWRAGEYVSLVVEAMQ